MKNELLRIVFVSSLALGALAITSPSYAQTAGGQTGGQTGGQAGGQKGGGSASNGSNAENNSGGGHFKSKARRWRGSPNYPRRPKRRTKAYIPAGECECTIRRASRNSNAATYKICKKRVQLNDGSLLTRACQPTG